MRRPFTTTSEADGESSRSDGDGGDGGVSAHLALQSIAGDRETDSDSDEDRPGDGKADRRWILRVGRPVGEDRGEAERRARDAGDASEDRQRRRFR
jgi:hypothetical protein